VEGDKQVISSFLNYEMGVNIPCLDLQIKGLRFLNESFLVVAGLGEVNTAYDNYLTAVAKLYIQNEGLVSDEPGNVNYVNKNSIIYLRSQLNKALLEVGDIFQSANTPYQPQQTL
jgi:hypothetical protein